MGASQVGPDLLPQTFQSQRNVATRPQEQNFFAPRIPADDDVMAVDVEVLTNR
jgi:hypothetical protein